MNERKLFGKLLPANEDIHNILVNIREKYDLPEIELGDDPLEAYLSGELDHEAIYQEIKTQVQAIDGIVPDTLKTFYQAHKSDTVPFPNEFINAPPEAQEAAKQLMQALMSMLSMSFIRIEAMLERITQNTFVYLLTGEAPEVDDDWFGEVVTSQMFGETVVMAIAGSTVDLKTIVDEFRAEHHRVFGKQEKITKGRMNTADHLRMKLEGKSIADIADNYIQRHLSEFPNDPRSKEYRESKKKLEDRLKKNNQRLEEFIKKRLGDKIE